VAGEKKFSFANGSKKFEESYDYFAHPRRATTIKWNMKPKLEHLQAANKKLAHLVQADPVYIPIFKRLQRELLLFEEQEDIVEDAKKVCRRHNDAA
jgi:hypothetical protein